MKKFSLILAMVFAGFMATAQQSSTVDQNGINNSALVNQDGAASPGNTSAIVQTGDDNDATVDQINNGYAGQSHAAEIYSIGDDNDASITQINATGNAIIDQLGDNNTAQIFQSGNFDIPIPGLEPYDAYVRQQGDNNEAYMTIFGTASNALAIQEGDNNLITQELGQDVGNKVQNSSIYAGQFGSWNEAVQIIDGQGFAGNITVLYERERILQMGNDNFAYQHQDDADNPTVFNYAEAEQVGLSNWSHQEQVGDANIALVLQLGVDNWSNQEQNGTINVSEVEQLGVLNWSEQIQQGILNISLVSQNGWDSSTTTQIGAFNYASVNQN